MDRRPTIADIAERAGISTGAVSYALNDRPGVSEATRERVRRIADELGWRPSVAARALSGARTYAVGLVLNRPAETLGVEPFFMQFIAGIEAELSAHRTALLLQLAPDEEGADAAVRLWWAERRIDGVIVADVREDDPRLETLRTLAIPAVVAGRHPPGFAGVWSDDGAAIAAVVDYLVALGHRRIVHVAGLPLLTHTRIRSEAFLAACRRHRLDSAAVVTTDYTWEAGMQVTRTLLSGADRPTAVAFDNDVMAVAALSVCREMGVAVPGELSIVAGDDSQLCRLVSPALSALSRDIGEYGRQTARLLLAQLDGGEPVSHELPPSRLVPRQSTAAPPDHA